MSMWEPFTEPARRSIVLAQEFAERAGSAEIASEHLLAGILAEGSEPLARLLIERGVTSQRVAAAIGEAPRTQPERETEFSAEGKKMIECAFEIARAYNHHYLSSSHLLAAVARLPESRAYGLLVAFGGRPEELQAALRSDSPAPVSVATMRRTYDLGALLEESIDRDPVAQLRRWIDGASAAGQLEPNAMSISTAGADGRPSARMVLLRGLDARGLVFYTSYFSRKGRQLAENPYAAALFYWERLERQVRIEGSIETISEEESEAYFATRPRGHRLGAWASEQSEIVENRDLLDARLRDYDERFADEEVPRPHSWGGYLLRPARFEFWQGRKNRMHDRLEFVRERNAWSLHRLQP